MIVDQQRDPGMQLAPKHSAFAPRRFQAPDPRADGRRRMVRLASDNVVIARVVGGVFMHVKVTTSAYRGVMLRVAGANWDGFSYEIRLVHADPDLCVVLAEASDDLDVHAEWRLWARVLGLPALVERTEGQEEPDRPMLGKVAVRATAPRRRGKAMTSRRARFLTRRKVGRNELCAVVEKDKHELFGGSNPER
jgi:Family of unknown function (DUF6101)